MGRKPNYLILSERMGTGETLEELIDKCHKIIESCNIPSTKEMLELDKINNPLLYGINDFIPWEKE